MSNSSSTRGRPPLPDSVVDDIVGEPRRRALLAHLAECEEPVALTDAATAVGADEAGTDPGDVRPADRRRIREDIYQRHLPKLTATGVVEFDSRRGTLALRNGAVAERVT